MSFIDLVFSIFIGGLLVASTIGYCLFIAYKWVIKDVVKSLEQAYDVYLKRSYETFEEK